MDLLASQNGKKPSYDKFTMKRYNAIVKYKTAYYSFHLPVALAMHMVCNRKCSALPIADLVLKI